MIFEFEKLFFKFSTDLSKPEEEAACRQQRF
jgi:hypothetical protein